MKLFISSKVRFCQFISFIALFSLVSSAQAFELVLQDHTGNIRHVSEVSGMTNVRLSVTNQNGQPVDGALITILLQEGYSATDIPQEEKLKQATAAEGVAVFKDVLPGRWLITASPDALVVAEIDVLDPVSMRAQQATVGTSLTTSTVVKGLVIAGVTAGGVVAIADASEGDPKKNDPSPFQ